MPGTSPGKGLSEPKFAAKRWARTTVQFSPDSPAARGGGNGRGPGIARLDAARKNQRNAAVMTDLETLETAAALVHRVVPPTPQHCWPLLSRRVGAEVWVKHENHTPIGAFKIRGGLVYL